MGHIKKMLMVQEKKGRNGCYCMQVVCMCTVQLLLLLHVKDSVRRT